TSPPKFSASSRRRGRASVRVVLCLGAGLSVAAGADHRLAQSENQPAFFCVTSCVQRGIAARCIGASKEQQCSMSGGLLPCAKPRPAILAAGGARKSGYGFRAKTCVCMKKRKTY